MIDIYNEKELTVEQLNEHWHCLEDPIVTGIEYQLDFAFACSDWWAVYAGAFNSIDALNLWFGMSDDNVFNGNILLNTESLDVQIIITLSDNRTYFLTVTGAGKEKLIEECESKCRQLYGLSCKELAEEEA